MLEAKPGLANYVGKKIILGIRPSDFEDASLASPGPAAMLVTAGVTEELGSEIIVIFTIDAPPVEHASIAQAAETADEAVTALEGGKAVWTARVSKESRVKHGAPPRAARRPALPAVLRPEQRPVDRAPEGQRRSGVAAAGRLSAARRCRGARWRGRRGRHHPAARARL